MPELISRQFVAQTDDVIIPFVQPDLAVRLTPGESVRWSGRADVTLLRHNRARPEGDRFEFAWNLVEPAEILITDERLIYRANTLSERSGRIAGIREGLRMGLSRSDQVLRPDAYIGQVRFPWVSNIMFRAEKKLGLSFGTVTINVIGFEALPLRLILTFSPGAAALAHALAAALAVNIALHRTAANADTLSAEQSQALANRRNGGDPVRMPAGTLRWDLPVPVPIMFSRRPVPAEAAISASPKTATLPELLEALGRAIDNLPDPGAARA